MKINELFQTIHCIFQPAIDIDEAASLIIEDILRNQRGMNEERSVHALRGISEREASNSQHSSRNSNRYQQNKFDSRMYNSFIKQTVDFRGFS